MSQIYSDNISSLLSGDVRTKSNRIRNSKRYTKRAPEVMVKISGHCRTASHTVAHMEYISRNGKLEIEDESGCLYQDKASIQQLAQDWHQDTESNKKRTRLSTHLVLSMPDGTEPKVVKQAVRQFAKKTFANNHQYVFALHTDTDSPHVHLTVKNLGFDGKRLHVRKGLPQVWRELFAGELERLGVAAEATPSLYSTKLQNSNTKTKEFELQL